MRREQERYAAVIKSANIKVGGVAKPVLLKLLSEDWLAVRRSGSLCPGKNARLVPRPSRFALRRCALAALRRYPFARLLLILLLPEEVPVSIHVCLNHVTHYRYDRPIMLGPQVVRLRPAPHSRTPILAYTLKVEPAKHFVNWQQDPQSNYLARLVFPEKTRELRIEVELTAELSVINPFDFFLEPVAEKIPFSYDPAQLHELAPYLVKLPPTPLFEKYLASIPREPTPSVDFLVALIQRLQRTSAISSAWSPASRRRK